MWPETGLRGFKWVLLPEQFGGATNGDSPDLGFALNRASNLSTIPVDKPVKKVAGP
jgi:hypothetical protein